MANVLSAALLAAQESASRFPLVEIKAGQFAADLPLAGQRLNAETLDQTGAASLLHSSGRLIAVYTQDEASDPITYPARAVKLAYTDPDRVEFHYADLFQASGNGTFYDLSLAEIADGRLALAYVLKDGSAYSLKIAVFAHDGSGLLQYSILSGQTLPI